MNYYQFSNGDRTLHGIGTLENALEYNDLLNNGNQGNQYQCQRALKKVALKGNRLLDLAIVAEFH